MRYLIVLFLFLIFGCNSPGNRKSPSEVKPNGSVNIKTVAVEFSIQGMSCTGCEQTIQSGINGLAGVKQVKANFKNGKAFVEFIPEIADTTRMKEKITASGYIVSGIKSISLDTLQSKF